MKSFKKFVEDAKYDAYVLKNTNMGQFMKTPNIETDVTRDLNKAYQFERRWILYKTFAFLKKCS